MSRNYYSPGSWNTICDSCSKKIKASTSKQRWDGLIVCPSCYEQRHPQDFVKARQDKITVPFSRPRPPDVFLLTYGIFENIPLTEHLSQQADYYITYSEDITLADSLDILKSFNIADAFTLTDSLALSLEKYVQDDIIVTEVIPFGYVTLLTDTVSITDSTSYSLTKTLTLTDITLITDTGSISLPVYAIDYFAEDYTLTSQSFT